MELTIKTYTGQKADFYIQSKGANAGRPLKNPKRNCFAVNTNIQNAYEIVFSLWKAKTFKYDIIGSCIPFVRISAVKKIVSQALSKADKYNEKHLKMIEGVDAKIANLNQQIEMLKQLQTQLALRENYNVNGKKKNKN